MQYNTSNEPNGSIIEVILEMPIKTTLKVKQVIDHIVMDVAMYQTCRI